MLNKYLFLLLTLLLLQTATQAQTPLTTAPDITVKTLKGDIIQLYSLLAENKVVVIDFFSTSCGPCQTFAHDFQEAYEGFGSNEGNVFFLGINYNGTNADVVFFDSLFNITLPSCSGLEGGGNIAFETFQIAAYPTVVVIQPDKTIAAQHVWEPTASNITAAVTAAGGIFVNTPQWFSPKQNGLTIYPQPAQGVLNITFDLDVSEPIEIQIKDLNGRTLHNEKHIAHPAGGVFGHKLDIGHLSRGIYVLDVKTSHGSIAQKVVFQ